MHPFRFAVMGAGGIANKFCDAVRLTEGAEVCAIASKSMERAKDFAARHGLPAAYDSYEEMLKAERPDCVYIAVTNDSHYPLAMLCLDYDTHVLCEKAMFQNSREAETFFRLADEKRVFSMEAMWSRYLPHVLRAREWMEEGRIGKPVWGEMSIGFKAKKDPENRLYSKKLGGGAALDITVYAYEVLCRILDRPVERISVEAVSSDTGVDLTDVVLMRFAGGVPAVLRSTFLTHPDERLVIEGEEGRIVLPASHVGPEGLLYRGDRLVEHFIDNRTKNGFTYEIEDAMASIRAGKTESETCPHAMTLSFAALAERIFAEMEP